MAAKSTREPAPVKEILDLYRYNAWANQRVLDLVGELSEEEIQRDLGSSFPSIGSTLAHMLKADWVWLSRWRGISPAAMPDWDLSSLKAIQERWSRLERDRWNFLELLTYDLLQGEIDYQNTSGNTFRAPLSQLLRHVVNHSTYHRGQVATLLRQLGRNPTATDMVVYHRARAGE